MAETKQNYGQPVQAPASGQTVAIKAIAGQDIVLTAAFDEAEIKMEGGNVVFAFANGGQVMLDFTDLDYAEAPNVIMPDGSVLDMQEYLAALSEGEVEPAAGPDAGGADSGGVGEYRDDSGNLIDGVDKLGVLDPREFTSVTVEALDADNPLEEPIPDGSEPIVSVTSGVVDEKGLLPDGTSAGDGSNKTSGSFGIDAGAAGLGRLEIQDKDGNWINVTGGGPVNGANGLLTVSLLDGAYSWSYELQNNLLTHDDTTFEDGDGISGVDDQQPGEAFPVRIFDVSGAVSPVVLLNITVYDDAPMVLQVEGQEGLENTVLYATLEEESVPDDGGVIGIDEDDGLSHTTGPELQSMTGAVNWGADGFGSLVGVQVGGATMISLGDADSVTVYFDADGAVLPDATGSSAMMMVYASGEYQLTVIGAMNHAPGDGMGGPIGENLLYLPTITFTGVDGDGDPASVSLIASVQDDIPVVAITSEVSSLLTLENHKADAGYNNSFGYYIKGDNGKPLEGVVIWDNVKNFEQGSITIKGYTPDQIGFFIIPDGDLLNASLSAATAVTFQFANDEWQAFANGAPLTGRGANVLFDVKSLNKDGLVHVVDNKDDGNLNWEDISGGGDRDYNDVNITAHWTVTQTGTLGEFGADGGSVVIDGLDPIGGFLVVTGLNGTTLTVNTETTEYLIESEFLHSYVTPPPVDSFSFSLVDGDNDVASATLTAMLQQNNPVEG
ncbi:MAG: hypothetical protein Q7J24_07780 [Desulfomicrobium sp.]|nr:hypothetical protein [Desulfomicrobium sp.]